MSDQQSATRKCPIKGCRNSLPPKDSHRTCLEHREKGRQHKKKVRVSMKRTRDNAELSDAFTEVLWTPLEHIGPTRMRRENTPGPWKCPKVCYLFTHTSFKAHSLQLDSLHLNMSIWLVCSMTSSHKSRPLVRVDYILMDILRKTATHTSMKRNISMDCAAIFI